MQKYYTANHLEHDSTPNKELMVEQYYKEGTHEALVDRDVYEDANRIIMMRDCKRGASQYPYYGRLICPHCGKPMVKVNTGRGKIPSCWICGGEDKGEFYKERTECPVYWVKEPYLSRAVIQAIIDLEVCDLDTDDALNVRWVQKQVKEKGKVEFIYLRKLVEYITFDGWDTLKVKWVWGEESTTPYRVDRVSDYPDQTVRVVDGEEYIGPFQVGYHQLKEVEKASDVIVEEILNTRIIADTVHRFSCPPIVEKRVG